VFSVITVLIKFTSILYINLRIVLVHKDAENSINLYLVTNTFKFTYFVRTPQECNLQEELNNQKKRTNNILAKSPDFFTIPFISEKRAHNDLSARCLASIKKKEGGTK